MPELRTDNHFVQLLWSKDDNRLLHAGRWSVLSSDLILLLPGAQPDAGVDFRIVWQIFHHQHFRNHREFHLRLQGFSQLLFAGKHSMLKLEIRADKIDIFCFLPQYVYSAELYPTPLRQVSVGT